MAKRMPKIGGVFLQAESELAAVNMVLGAAAAGKRAMTSSSSPGISLKSEGLSYIAACDLPALVVNVQRGGPGLGGIQPSQSDYFQAVKGGSHGDMRKIVLAPASVQEMASLTVKGFDLADQYRMIAMILADGTMGQMMEPVELPEHKDRKLPEKPWAACGHENKREHNIINSLYLTPNALEDLVRARYERYKIVEEKEQRAEEYRTEDADVIVVAYGASSRVARSAVNKAREAGKKVGLIRPITLWPFPKDAIKRAADHAKELLVVEMSMGQMVDDVRLAAECRVPVHFYGRTGGVIPTPKEILGEIDKLLK
ncbi:3-methyl-2-oxobutanoate dehydrogenase subunit VorB, partial [Hominenteromicrobium sp.]|uniref:3-methyl-2-oxobutanoate dehydrogenase subunit VorB n=1 Tax=Hominenteromicrobium sp. TaxID=3073581 RepID=UPI003A934911